jgi:two-component sensor histidine kinase
MNTIIAIFFLLLISFPLKANEQQQKLISELDKAIEKKTEYKQLYINKIEKLKDKHISTKSNNAEFKAIEEITKLYITFDYDSSIVYVSKLARIAKQIGNKEFINQAKILQASIFITSGIFHEAINIFESINEKSLNKSQLTEFYTLYSRLFLDMVSYFNKSKLSDEYNQKGKFFLWKAIGSAQPDSFNYKYLKGLKLLMDYKPEEAEKYFVSILNKNVLDDQKMALVASTYAFVRIQKQDEDGYINWLVRAAIADIKFANKEYQALSGVAQKLFERGDINRASRYLKISLDDAEKYGAMQRKIHISEILPIVESKKQELIKEQSKRIQNNLYIVSSLMVILILVIAMLFYLYFKIKQSRRKVQVKNNMLRELNIIKESYVGLTMTASTQLLDIIENIRQDIENKFALNKLNAIKKTVTRTKVKEYREDIFKMFDETFLSIFPSYVVEFNKLFSEENKILDDHSKHLNTEYRIFALIRLGITDTEKIAHTLNYSVNTINTYKSKVKNLSLVNNEDFETKVKKIGMV